MKINKKYFDCLFYKLFGVFICYILFFNQVFALTVSPPRMEFSGDPGHTISGSFVLINESTETKTYFSSFSNFEAAGETGAPRFLEEEKGLATWIETLPQVTLRPEEEKEIPFNIRIPENADPGGHFAAIFWGSAPRLAEGGEVAVGSKVGILVLLRVSGEIPGGGGLIEFSTENNQKLFTSLPVNLFWRFSNNGGDRVQPDGYIRIRNAIGITVTEIPANIGKGNVLPASVRRFNVSWSPDQASEFNSQTGFLPTVIRQWNNFRLGYYKANLELEHNLGGNYEIRSSTGFFIFPWQLLIIIIPVLIITIALIFLGIKKYNRWIIYQAKNSGK